MKFKHPIIGIVIEDLLFWLPIFCSRQPFYTIEERCKYCPLQKTKTGIECWRLVTEKPEKAALLMGYEIIYEENEEKKEEIK